MKADHGGDQSLWSHDMDLESQSLPNQPFSAEMRSDTLGTASNTLACNIGTLLTFGRRTGAEETFARKLHLKLKGLGGSQEQDLSTSSSSPPTWSLPVESYSSLITNRAIISEIAAKHAAAMSNANKDGGSSTRSPVPESIQNPTELSLNMTNGTEESSKPTKWSSSSGNSGVLRSTEESNGSSDSDIYYDFDIGSPGSPVENGSCFALINPSDNLSCPDCSSNASAPLLSIKNMKGDSSRDGPCQRCSRIQHHNDDHHEIHTGSQSSSDPGFESGCVFSSPASLSPDGVHPNGEHEDFGSQDDNDKSESSDSQILLPEEISLRVLESSLDLGDASSDVSDSVYYDIESSGSNCPSPKSETVENTNTNGQVEKEVEKECPKEPEISVATTATVAPKATLPLLVPTNDRQLLSPNFGIDSDDSESEDRPRIVRSSSLKTGKTPPGTPGRKKIVRFADVLGLDLADVRTFLDEIPNVPKSAFRDLDYALEAQNAFSVSAKSMTTFTKTLVPTFHQPVSRPDFFDRIREQKVLLENAFLSDNFTIKGTVRVKNMDFHKSLYIRYTMNEWKTYVDFQATYVNGSCDGFSDKFDFSIPLSQNCVEIGEKVMFAARFHCLGKQHWDNNTGQNYIFHCVPASSQNQQSHLYNPLSYSPSEEPWTNHMWM